MSGVSTHRVSQNGAFRLAGFITFVDVSDAFVNKSTLRKIGKTLADSTFSEDVLMVLQNPSLRPFVFDCQNGKSTHCIGQGLGVRTLHNIYLSNVKI